MYRPVYGYLFVAPLVAWLGVTVAIPLVSMLGLSVTNAGVIGVASTFVGLAEYRDVISDPAFWSAALNTAIWILANGLAQTLLGFTTAVLLSGNARWMMWARVWMIIPWIIPSVAVVIIWRWLLSSLGVINYLLRLTGMTSVSFFSSPGVAMATTIFINTWKWFPFLAVILVAGLRSVPREIHEAAMVDGASPTQAFFAIDLPTIAPLMFVMGLLGTLWSANVFDVIWLLTKGGPAGGTTTLPVYVYETAFSRFSLGASAAAATLFATMLLAFVALVLRTGWGRSQREEGR